MPTSNTYLSFLLDQLSAVDGISHRKMMGEYILYLHGRIAAYACDDRLLVKPVPGALRLMPDAPMEPPYEGAAAMLLVEQVDDREFLQKLFETMYPDLPEARKKKSKP